MSTRTRTIVKSKQIETIREVLTGQNMPSDRIDEVIEDFAAMTPKGYVFNSQGTSSVAALFFLLGLERPDAEDDEPDMAEYRRLRAITQNLTTELLDVKGYASVFGGEPEVYGMIRALLLQMIEVTREEVETPVKKEDIQ